jgi:hypothetical protein
MKGTRSCCVITEANNEDGIAMAPKCHWRHALEGYPGRRPLGASGGRVHCIRRRPAACVTRFRGLRACPSDGGDLGGGPDPGRTTTVDKYSYFLFV